MISYYRKIIAEPFQRYKHNERCQIIMKSHSKVCIIQNNCCPLPLLNKLKGSLCNHSGGICRNQKQKRNTGFYNLPLFFSFSCPVSSAYGLFSSASLIVLLNKSISRPSAETYQSLILYIFSVPAISFSVYSSMSVAVTCLICRFFRRRYTTFRKIV